MVMQAEVVFIETLGTRGVLVSRYVWILEYSDSVAMTLKGFQISRFWVRDTGLCLAEWRCWELRLGGQEGYRLGLSKQEQVQAWSGISNGTEAGTVRAGLEFSQRQVRQEWTRAAL